MPQPLPDLARLQPLVAGLHEDPTTVLLELAQIYCERVTGEPVSKDIAAQWAHIRFPHIALARARAIHVAGLPDDYTGIDIDYAARNLCALIAQQDRP